jgi:signal transduction histidine kinase/ActR/RegA family two-component response regulator
MLNSQTIASDDALLKHLFTHGGEMGARIQEFDWSTTPIGSYHCWPQSLRLALQILLSSKFPMQILWGSDYVQFYNDAYIPIAGEKHPAGLGQRGEDCWQEVWEFAGPLLDGVMATGIATWSEDQLLVLHRNGHPEECYFTFSYTPIWQQPGLVGGIFIAIQETTQRILSERHERELHLETQAARAEAERANQLKDHYLAVLSHELRSPLNPILGWARLLRSQTFNSITTERALETIERNARLQAQMIDDLLDISRILKGKLELNLKPFNFIPVINQALETVQAQAQAKSIDMQTRLSPAPLKVLGDANRLQQVVWNLLSNAIKFSPDAGQVAIHLDYDDGQAVLQVRDGGKGIEADFLPYVFDRFRQADTQTTKVFGGLGLGLAIAKQIVDGHGGMIQAESAGAGQGAVFSVSLPLTDITETPAVADTFSPTADTLSDIHVLVVEDDEDGLELLTQILQMYGAEVTAVASVQAALAAVTARKPDVLISDIGLPTLDGFTLMQQLRQNFSEQEMPAIALTAYVSETDQERAFEAGFQVHLPKPMESVTLVKAIVNLTRRNSIP